jgi:Enoyl-CoA hydratase/carnithine racemase
MSEAPVTTQRRGKVALVTLNRPADRNPLDRQTASGLVAAFSDAFADDAVRAVAVTGAGDAFCAGGDLRQMAQLGSMEPEQAWAWPSAIVELHQMMLTAPKPVVAAVNGPAFAGGMGLAAICDVVLATRRARFALPEVKVGLFPMIVVAHLVRSVPRKLLMEMMFTGDPISAEEAQQAGFVRHVYDDTEAMMAAVVEYGERFSRASPQAVRLGRRAFTLLAEMPASQALDAAQLLNVPFFLGPDLAEGAAAFLEKRRPSWIEGQ